MERNYACRIIRLDDDTLQIRIIEAQGGKVLFEISASRDVIDVALRAQLNKWLAQA